MKEKNLQKSMDWRDLAGPFAALTTLAAMWVAARYAHNVDFEHMGRPIRAFIEGNWSAIYPENTAGTSPTGWVLLAGIPAFVFSWFVGAAEAYTLASLLVLPALLFSVRYTLRSLWPNVTPHAAWLLAAASVWLPTTLATYLNAYHPQDLAATALIVLALGLLHRRHMVPAGVVFGLAVMTRQWALLALLPAAGFTRGHGFWRFALPVGVCVAALTAPFAFLGGNEGWVTAFTSSSVGGNGDTILGMLQRQDVKTDSNSGDFFLLIARFLPVVLAAGAGVYAWMKRLSLPQQLVALTLFALSTRMMFDVSNYMYYWVPFAVFALLLIPYKRSAWMLVALISLGPWALDTALPTIGTTVIDDGQILEITRQDKIARAVFTLLLALSIPVGAWLLLDNKTVETAKPEKAQERDSEGNTKGGTERDEEGDPSKLVKSAWIFVVSACVGMLVLLTWDANELEPPKEIRRITEVQREARDMLEEQGVDVGDGRVGREL